MHEGRKEGIHLHRAVKRVKHEHGNGGDLCGPVPPIAAVHHDRHL
jgi:hypothetical protein